MKLSGCSEDDFGDSEIPYWNLRRRISSISGSLRTDIFLYFEIRGKTKSGINIDFRKKQLERFISIIVKPSLATLGGIKELAESVSCYGKEQDIYDMQEEDMLCTVILLEA